MPLVPIVPCPPGDDSRFVRFLNIRPGPTVLVWCLGNHVIGFNTHFLSGRTVPCVGPANGCVCRFEPVTSRWVGVIDVQPATSRVPFLLGITRGAYAACPELAVHQHSLRGCQLAVSRRGERSTSPLVVAMTSMPPGPERPLRLGFPPSIDVCHHLARIWGYQIQDTTPLPGSEEGKK